MHGVAREGVVGDPWAQLERSVGQVVRVDDAGIDGVGVQPGGADGQQIEIVRQQAVIGRAGRSHRREGGRARVAHRGVGRRRVWWRQRRVRPGDRRVDRIGGRVRGLVLLRRLEARAGRAVGVDDPLRAQVEDDLAGLRLVGGEQVVEGAVLADDDDHVLDRRQRVVVVRSAEGLRDRRRPRRDREGERRHPGIEHAARASSTHDASWLPRALGGCYLPMPSRSFIDEQYRRSTRITKLTISRSAPQGYSSATGRIFPARAPGDSGARWPKK